MIIKCITDHFFDNLIRKINMIFHNEKTSNFLLRKVLIFQNFISFFLLKLSKKWSVMHKNPLIQFTNSFNQVNISFL